MINHIDAINYVEKEIKAIQKTMAANGPISITFDGEYWKLDLPESDLKFKDIFLDALLTEFWQKYHIEEIKE